jgi:hypothetical protein
MRDHDQATGRYLQPDPIGLAGGVNLYGYVSANPLNSLDSLGLSECDILAAEELMKKNFPDDPDMAYPPLSTTSFANLNVNPGATNRKTHAVTGRFFDHVTFDISYAGILDEGMALEFLDTYIHESFHRAEPMWIESSNSEEYNSENGIHNFISTRSADFAGLLFEEFQLLREKRGCICQ